MSEQGWSGAFINQKVYDEISKDSGMCETALHKGYCHDCERGLGNEDDDERMGTVLITINDGVVTYRCSFKAFESAARPWRGLAERVWLCHENGVVAMDGDAIKIMEWREEQR